jgi:small subunit ribosomal protein S3
MVYEKKFIEEPISKYQVMKFLEKELDRAWLANVDIQRTPLVSRITIEVMNPGKVIGRKGRFINDLTEKIKTEFKIENPQISVVEVQNPSLEPRVVAKKAAKYIEMGKNVRSVIHFLIRDAIAHGALGAEIYVAGKIGAKGARSKSMRVSAGYIPSAGEPARLVREAHVNAVSKSGVIGVLARIVLPGTVFPDKKPTEVVPISKVVATAELTEQRAQAGAPAGQGGPRGPPQRKRPYFQQRRR